MKEILVAGYQWALRSPLVEQHRVPEKFGFVS